MALSLEVIEMLKYLLEQKLIVVDDIKMEMYKQEMIDLGY